MNCSRIDMHCTESCIGLTGVRKVRLFIVHQWSDHIVKLSSVIMLFGQTPWQLTLQVKKLTRRLWFA